METEPTDILNVDDFKTIELGITVENQTTKTSIFENRKVFPKGQGDVVEPGHFPIYLVELLDQGFTLDLPARSCSTGHVLKVSIETRNTPETKYFVFTVKAQEPRKSDEKNTKKSNPSQDRQMFDFEIIQFEEDVWMAFLAVFEKKQNAILELFESIKGY